MAACSADFYCRDYFDAFLVVFRSYCNDVYTSEAAEKISADGKYTFCTLWLVQPKHISRKSISA